MNNVHRMKQEAANLASSIRVFYIDAGKALSKAARLDKHWQARLDAIDEYTGQEFDPGWPTELRELAEKLRMLAPAVSGTDEAHVDLCISVATFLDTVFGDGDAVGTGGDALAETLGASPADEEESPHSLVSSTLAKAEANRNQRVTMGTETIEGD